MRTLTVCCVTFNEYVAGMGMAVKERIGKIAIIVKAINEEIRCNTKTGERNHAVGSSRLVAVFLRSPSIVDLGDAVKLQRKGRRAGCNCDTDLIARRPCFIISRTRRG